MKRLSGMSGFSLIWLGQVVSLIGTSVTNFAFTIWAYELTGQATSLALIGFFFFAPQIATGLFAGAIVDRFNRRTILIVSDLASGLATTAVLILFATGNLQVWHIYVNAAIAGTFQNFQWIAYAASITLLVPQKHYERANSLVAIAEAGSGILAPAFAGAFYGFIGLEGILAFDVITFVFAVSVLLFVKIPDTKQETTEPPNLWKESISGLQYIYQRPSLLGLMAIFLLGNFFVTVPVSVVSAMMLARTNNNEIILGFFQTAGALGGVIGAMAMTAWGGAKDRIRPILLGWSLSGIIDLIMLVVTQTLPLWLISRFFGAFINPFINTSSQALWQSKVPADIQGRVFGVRRFLAFLTLPISFAIGGPLADYWLEPAMQPDGYLTPYFGWLVGTGDGAGMAILFVFFGALTTLIGIIGYFIPAVRHIETLLPNYSDDEYNEAYVEQERSM